MSLATVGHHIRLLRDLGFIPLTGTEPRRGAIEHFYRPVLGIVIRRLRLRLDADGTRELTQAMHELLRRAEEIQERSDERLAGQRQDARATCLAVVHVAAGPRS